MKNERKDSRGLSNYYMTTKEIALKWNEERYSVDNNFKEWTAKSIASKFKYIFKKLDIMAYLDCYKVNKGFDFSKCIDNMEQNINYFMEAEPYMSEEFEKLAKNFEVSFNELRECSIKEKKYVTSGDFIFNQEAFLEKEDRLKRVFEIVEKKNIPKDEWEKMIECLIKLQPELNNPYMMKEMMDSSKSKGKKKCRGVEIDYYIELKRKMEEMSNVLKDKYILISFEWCFDLINNYNRNYERILSVFEEVIKKYRHFLNMIEKIRIIEECFENKGDALISIDDIFEYSLFLESKREINDIKEKLNKKQAREKLEIMISEFSQLLYSKKLDEDDEKQLRLAFIEDMKYVKKLYDEKDDKMRNLIKLKCSEKGYGDKVTNEDINKYEWMLLMKKVDRLK